MTPHRKVIEAARLVLLVCLTPFLEKNPLKIAAVDSPVVLSMRRIIAFAFAVVMVRQAWKAGIVSWPEAALSIATIFALPFLGGIDRLSAKDFVMLVSTFFGRLG